MTSERRKDLLALAILLAVLVLFFSKILFTDKIIRAPDIINEYYWSVLKFSKQSLWDIFSFNLKADWDIYGNSGNTLEGGGVGAQFQFLQLFIYYFIGPPASVAWHIVLHLFFGACGVYLCCRTIGAGRLAAFIGGIIFALSPENASLINAGHVMKIATISLAPWAFYFIERGFQSRRVIFFMTTAFVLAFQFFYTHWQIAYYTCLGIGLYGILRSIGILVTERSSGGKGFLRLFGLNLVTLVFFLSTVSISLLPLANWSTATNRGAQSGANQGAGGLEREEAMSWSLPPEELATFVIPGMFGFSRQEGGENPTNIPAYYWGRMNFTQTTDYLGLLPWLLLPLPLIFRRDRYTWLALAAVGGGLLFSLGKYSLVYQFLFDYFPGVNRFRVPKMIMFLPVMGVAVLAARGIDLLGESEVTGSRGFRRYLWGIAALPVVIVAMLGVELAGKEQWISRFADILSQPTRFEQGPQLLLNRWNNLVQETCIAGAVAALYGMALWLGARWQKAVKYLPLMLAIIYLGDVARVNAKFMFLVDVPPASRGTTTPVIDYLSAMPKEYRVMPLSSDPSQYVSHKIPVLFVSMPVQQVRWQDILDNFSFNSPLPDMLNLKYLIMNRDEYAQQRGSLGSKFVPVFQSPDGSQIVLENRAVLPKAWLTPAVEVLTNVQQTLALLQNPGFDPRLVSLVESPPPLAMLPPNAAVAVNSGEVAVPRYTGEKITVNARIYQNSLLVLGEKYYPGWKAKVDGSKTEIYPVNHILRGVYLPPGDHVVEFVFDPLPFKIGKYLTLASFVLFAFMLGWEAMKVVKRRGREA